MNKREARRQIARAAYMILGTVGNDEWLYYNDEESGNPSISDKDVQRRVDAWEELLDELFRRGKKQGKKKGK